MKKYLSAVVILLLSTTYSYSAGSDPKTTKVKNDYSKAVESIKWAKKYEKKNATRQGVPGHPEARHESSIRHCR